MLQVAAAVLILAIGAAAHAQDPEPLPPPIPASTRVVARLPLTGVTSVLTLYGVRTNGAAFRVVDSYIVLNGWDLVLFRVPYPRTEIGGMIVCNERTNPPPEKPGDLPEHERVCGKPWTMPAWRELPEPGMGISMMVGAIALVGLARRRRTGGTTRGRAPALPPPPRPGWWKRAATW